MMLGLYLIAAHLVGDFVLQTRWQAERKLTDWRYRARHVGAYCLPFVPLAFVESLTGHTGVLRFGHWSAAAVFLLWLAVLHFTTDSRRFRSTLGDVLAWRAMRSTTERINAVLDPHDRIDQAVAQRWIADRAPFWPPAGQWAPLPIMLDQTLHAVQLAILGGLFLS